MVEAYGRSRRCRPARNRRPDRAGHDSLGAPSGRSSRAGRATRRSPRPFRSPMTDELTPPAADIPALDRRLLEELEPEAGRLLERHLKVAQEWFPHEYIPYRLGRDFDKEPWTPDQPRLTGVAQTSFEVGLLTE